MARGAEPVDACIGLDAADLSAFINRRSGTNEGHFFGAGETTTLQQPVNVQDIEQQILSIVAAEAMVDLDRLGLDAPLAKLDIQSADYVMILMAVDEKFGVYISVDSELTEAKTVGDLVRVVADRIIAARESAIP